MTLLELSERKAKEALPSPSCPALPSCGPCWADGVGVGHRFLLEDDVAPAGAETFISSMHLPVSGDSRAPRTAHSAPASASLSVLLLCCTSDLTFFLPDSAFLIPFVFWWNVAMVKHKCVDRLVLSGSL